jgi:peptide/nickel transport system ATP-binding protein
VTDGESTPLLAVEDVEKYYDDEGLFGDDPVRAVDGVSFELRAGETLGLVGESGCGKTTLGRTVVKLEDPTGGRIVSRGRDVTDLSGTQRRVWQQNAQIVFQDPESSLNDRMTVGEIVREPLDGHDWGQPDERADRVFDLLDRVGLQEEHYYRYPHQFSGGQLQRVGIARALALEPDFVVLDEPVSALDVSVQARIINLLEDLQRDLELTYLFIAHDLSVVRHIADRVAVMYLGNVVELGPTERVFRAPQHPYTQSLLSAIPGLDADDVGVTDQEVPLRGTPPSPRDPPSGCPFATRCPAKIRPDEYDLPEPAWAAIEEFRAVLAERARSSRSLADVVRRRLPWLDSPDDVAELRDTLFADVALSADATTAVERASALASAGDAGPAAALLREEFGSVCDSDVPVDHERGEAEVEGEGEGERAGDGVDHRSACHRHQTEYEGSTAVFRARAGAYDRVRSVETDRDG